jgi:hypothetical protein
METFMVKTGFYDIVTRKEAERRAERQELEEDSRKRLEQLNIKIK